MQELPDVYVVNIYTPNSGEGLRRLDYRVGPNGWDACFAKHVTSLVAKGKPVVVAGDLNCAHKDIDIHEPKRNLKSAGFTPVSTDATAILQSIVTVTECPAVTRGVVAQLIEWQCMSSTTTSCAV